MKVKARLFCLLLAVAVTEGRAHAQQPAGRRVLLGDSGLSLGLPTGWRNADRKPEHKESFGAFQSLDSTSSVFVSLARASDQAGMTQIMEGVIKNFETAFIVKRVGEFKQGKLADSVAIFTTLDAKMRSAKGPETIAFRFYLAVFDTGKGLHLFQGSCQAPVKPEREREIIAMMRSLAKVKGAGGK